MDALAIILRTVTQIHEAKAGQSPEALQPILEEAERQLRSSLGGGFHHISRLPDVPTKARIVALAGQGVPNAAISERLGVSDRYVRRIVSQLRRLGD